MPGLDLFEKLSLVEVAQVLEVHPFELARLLGAKGELPRDLRFDESEIGRLRSLAGVETWWTGGALPVEGKDRSRSLVRSLAHLILERGLPGAAPTRADNLFRGLATEEAAFMRRVVNQLIREELAVSSSSARGLLFQVPMEQASTFRAMAAGEELTPGLESICN